jgi:hypothetical protein
MAALVAGGETAWDGSSMSVHLVADRKLGSLKLYSRTPGTFSETDVEEGQNG